MWATDCMSTCLSKFSTSIKYRRFDEIMGGQTRMNFWTSQSSGNQGVQTLEGIQRCNLSDELTVFGHNVRNDSQILGEGGHS